MKPMWIETPDEYKTLINLNQITCIDYDGVFIVSFEKITGSKIRVLFKTEKEAKEFRDSLTSLTYMR